MEDHAHSSESSIKINQNSLHDHGYRNIGSSRLLLVLILTAIVMFAEIFVGYYINSLALIADGGHMINDVLSLIVTIAALRISTKDQSKQYTFGYKRVEVLSGFINGVSLLGISIYIIYEAISRLLQDTSPHISGNLMFVTALLGLLINAFGMYLLREPSNDNINMEGAYHHIVADLLGSVAAIIASLSIIFWNLYWTDIFVSLVISVLILKSGISITRKALRIILQASPKGKDVDVILGELMETPGVKDVHDLHCWTLTSGIDLITGHITVDRADNSHEILASLVTIAKNHGYNHPTFQIELDSCVSFGDCFPFVPSQSK